MLGLDDVKKMVCGNYISYVLINIFVSTISPNLLLLERFCPKYQTVFGRCEH